MTSNQIAFIVMAIVALFGALGVVFFHSPIRAALALVLNFFTLGLIYFLLGAQMIGISQIMVYAGAIMVLFLFVIMMLRSDETKDKPQLGERRFLFSLLGALALGAVVFLKAILPVMGSTTLSQVPDYGRPQYIGMRLFTEYVWPFEMISILLLVGIVGSIMLAKRKF
ncbi:MAG: NADH-quinone oxidoreductase subunit J [Armatimonadetes bacterium]|nr:NADH-quinone oxidoreductase subunit J [Armatimonadota bacterium]